MGYVLFQATLAAGTIASLIIAVFGFFNKPNQFDEAKATAKKDPKKTKIAFFVACFQVYRRQIILVLFAIILGLSFALIAVLVHPPGIVAPPTPTPTTTPTPKGEASVAPTLYHEIKLYDLPLLRVDEGAFFFQEWDQFKTITINNVAYPQSIGVRIPEEAQKDYYKNYNTLRKDHKAIIEYSLANKYKTLRFHYGIDDSSSPYDKSCVAQCHYWIVVQSCSAEDDHFEKEDLLFQSKQLNYYQSLHSSGDIDVSGAEAVRITVYWEFDVMQTKPLAFNVAIVNPTLYY